MRRWLLSGLAAIAVAIFAAGGWAWRTTTAPLPKTGGNADVSGISARVEIIRDKRGIAHIFAANKQDLLFGQGYLHAQDRWFTMDFYRRIARGELAGLVGGAPEVIENDRLMRTLGFAELAARDYAALDGETRAAIDAFAAGVNAYVKDRKPNRLAVEYSVLKLGGLNPEIRPWTAEDSLAVGKLMGFALSGKDATIELERAAMRSAVNPEMYAQWRPGYDYGRHPTVIAAEDLPVIAEAATRGDQREGRLSVPVAPQHASLSAQRSFAFLERLGFAAEGAGSNSWVVSGAHTKSGLPMLAVDPHNGIELPNLWHEIGLHIRNADDPSADISIYGFAAAPFFLILEGTNDFGAWGTTNVTGGDALDLFRLTINPENTQQYLWDGEWRKIEQAAIEISVAGGAPVKHVLERTHFGPILPAPENEPRYAVQWGGFERSALARASVKLPFNKSYEELRAALADWDFPPTHFIYAGKNGDIGIQQAGRYPIRAPGADGSIPQDGSNSDVAWRGYLPYALMPHVKNPANGVIVTGNNPVAPPDYFDAVIKAHNIDGEIDFLKDAARGYRGARITERLAAEGPHDVDSFADIQRDTLVPGLRASLQAVLDATASEPSPCRTALVEWRGEYTMDSAGALVFAHLWTEVLDEVYAPHFPVGVKPKVGMTELLSLETILADAASGWWDDPETDVRETRQDRLSGLLSAACDSATKAYGMDTGRWAWGEVHRAHFKNEILNGSGIGLLKWFGNRGPIPTFGGAATVSIGRWRHGDGFDAVHIPGYRFIIDLAAPTQALVINSTGQSSHPASAHYADQMKTWAAGNYDVRRFDEASLRSRAEHKLILNPADAR